jgi:hypothetical protein
MGFLNAHDLSSLPTAFSLFSGWRPATNSRADWASKVCSWARTNRRELATHVQSILLTSSVPMPSFPPAGQGPIIGALWQCPAAHKSQRGGHLWLSRRVPPLGLNSRTIRSPACTKLGVSARTEMMIATSDLHTLRLCVSSERQRQVFGINAIARRVSESHIGRTGLPT